MESAHESLGPVHRLGPGAIAQDGQVVTLGRGADVKPEGLAGGIGEPVAVAPDLQLVGVVAGLLVKVFENGVRPDRATRDTPPWVSPAFALLGHGRL